MSHFGGMKAWYSPVWPTTSHFRGISNHNYPALTRTTAASGVRNTNLCATCSHIGTMPANILSYHPTSAMRSSLWSTASASLTVWLKPTTALHISSKDTEESHYSSIGLYDYRTIVSGVGKFEVGRGCKMYFRVTFLAKRESFYASGGRISAYIE